MSLIFAHSILSRFHALRCGSNLNLGVSSSPVLRISLENNTYNNHNFLWILVRGPNTSAGQKRSGLFYMVFKSSFFLRVYCSCTGGVCGPFRTEWSWIPKTCIEPLNYVLCVNRYSSLFHIHGLFILYIVVWFNSLYILFFVCRYFIVTLHNRYFSLKNSTCNLKIFVYFLRAS